MVPYYCICGFVRRIKESLKCFIAAVENIFSLLCNSQLNLQHLIHLYIVRFRGNLSDDLKREGDAQLIACGYLGTGGEELIVVAFAAS